MGTQLERPEVSQILTAWLLRWRYAILCLSVFCMMCFHARNGQWVGDFWEHSAVVRELATHILQPQHPQLLLDAPHAFYSPYAVLVALLARLFHVDAITALSVMGLINLFLLFIGLRLFSAPVDVKCGSAVAFYALLFTLFCWGAHPWEYSGFFHIGVLGYVLPYPSTFATALTLIALGLYQRRIELRQPFWLVLVFPIVGIVLISHPITYVVLAAGLFSQVFAEKGSALPQVVFTGSLLALAFVAAMFWPYFPLYQLLAHESPAYHIQNKTMYFGVVSRIWPSLFALPVVVARVRSNWRHPWNSFLAIMLVIYAFGAISGKYAYGRVISFVVLMLHLAMAERLSKYESQITPLGWTWRRLAVPVGVVCCVLFLSLTPLLHALSRSFSVRPPTYADYQFLRRFLGQYDTVLTDVNSGWIVPTFGGKVVAVPSSHPLAYISDQNLRAADITRFFDADATFTERTQIIHKYKANYLLLNKVEIANWQDLRQMFAPPGEVLFETEKFVLVSLVPSVTHGRPLE